MPEVGIFIFLYKSHGNQLVVVYLGKDIPRYDEMVSDALTIRRLMLVLALLLNPFLPRALFHASNYYSIA